MLAARAAALIAVMLLVCVGCGQSSSSSSSAVSANIPAGEQETVRVADCRLWRVLSSPSRDRLVGAMRRFFGGPVDAARLRGQVLPDARAKSLFDSYCARRFATAFKLYKIYGRAAAFTPAR